MTTTGTVDALGDREAVRVLALVLDHQDRLPEPARLRELHDAARQAAADDPDLTAYREEDARPPSSGDLARSALSHLAETNPGLGPVIERAARMADERDRIEPATAAIGGLVLLALQTEITVERTTAGKWRFKLHKRPMRDSTLGRLIGKLLALPPAE